MKIAWAKPKFWGREREYLNDAFDSTWISEGKYVDELERRFADLHGYRHGISTANGTGSIFLALRALKIGLGDEVIVPGFGFIAAINMVLEVGARPVCCDVDPQTFQLDVTELEKKVTSKTRAVIPIHTYGNVCDMDEICAIAKRHGFYVLEDAAEAIFSKYHGRYCGGFSEISSFSFQTTKTITTGEGGMLLTQSDELAADLRKLRSHGMGAKKYWHLGVAYNFRLTNLQAAIGLAQLECLDAITTARSVLYRKFMDRVIGIDGIETQLFRPEVDPVVWAFPIILSPKKYRKGRDHALGYLESKGIECRPAFYTPNELPAYATPFLGNSDFVAKHTLTLPFHVDLTDEEIDYIFKTLKEIE